MRFKSLVLMGVMIIVSLFYFFFEDFKGAKVKDNPTRDAKAVAAEKK